MKNKRMPLVILLTALLSLPFQSFGKDVIVSTKPNADLDLRAQYPHAVLRKSLEMSMQKYGFFEIKLVERELDNFSKMMEVHDGIHMNLTMAMTTPDWEYLNIPIRIPIRRGMANFRLLATNEKYLDKFSQIKTLAQLKELSAGVVSKWSINEILGSAGIPLVETSNYDSLFKMLNKGRFDYTPRGINEAFYELNERKDTLTNIVIEPNLVLYMLQPYYIFVSPKHPRIAERIEYGLEEMIKHGILKKMFVKHHAENIAAANLNNRTVIKIHNKFLTNKTPINRKELWMIYDEE
ncbi:substrate-binding periplasmic protein [Catenovulum agarivorans]|uniref:substrate-binding periplasmic protein n=1 Tax=Catenovulum agarivorans TaxID=1172192 RepID=UPI0002DA4039|nr:transporter substrate-binding domain-containing protein [Catenovulum agarivorans]